MINIHNKKAYKDREENSLKATSILRLFPNKKEIIIKMSM